MIAAAAGVLIIFAGGVISAADLSYAAGILWRPLLALASIMVMAAAADGLGVLRWLAARFADRADAGVSSTFTYVFVASALAAMVLNNDSAVILLTPLAAGVAMRLYPERPDLVEPFAFAVFLAPGVAPFLTSNPMNMIVGSYAGLSFNQYATRMLPIAVATNLITYAVLRAVYRKALSTPAGPTPVADAHPPLGRAPAAVIAILLAVLLAYPVVSYLGGQIWMVALAGATVCAAVAMLSGVKAQRLRQGIPFEVLFFLAGLFLIALGMRNAGAIAQLSGWYQSFLGAHQQLGVIGATSLAGSALINNHPMAILNMLALQTPAAADPAPYLAALIGGDLGPRLLPIGSLAGLLWLEALRRMGIHVRLQTFLKLGLLTAGPAFAVSLALLFLLH